MPIFEFQCEECLTVFEELAIGGKPKNLICTKCGSKTVKRLMSGAHFNKYRKCGRPEDCDYCPGKRYNMCR